MKRNKYNLKEEEKISAYEENENFIIKEYKIPKETPVLIDKRTKVKTIGIPINFPSSINGMVGITHLSAESWRPDDDIESIIIVYKNI